MDARGSASGPSRNGIMELDIGSQVERAAERGLPACAGMGPDGPVWNWSPPGVPPRCATCVSPTTRLGRTFRFAPNGTRSCPWASTYES